MVPWRKWRCCRPSRGRPGPAYPADELLIDHLTDLDHAGLACRCQFLGSRLPRALCDHFLIDLRDDQDWVCIAREESDLADESQMHERSAIGNGADHDEALPRS